MAKYDLAISFAGEQRELANSVARRLDASGYSVFYDEFQRAELWGRDLSTSLAHTYSEEARFCLVLLSDEYINKAWTNFERQNAISRFMREKEGYILCLKIDDVKLPGLPDVISYLDCRSGVMEDDIYKLLLAKLGTPCHDDAISQLTANDRTIAREIIKACYRRAIFTRMSSEIDLEAMYSSIRQSLGVVQRLIPEVQDQALQCVVVEMMGALDDIERCQRSSDARVSNHLPTELANEIDEKKTTLIRLLLEVRRAAAIPIQLPFSIRTDHFFGLDNANSPPRLENELL